MNLHIPIPKVTFNPKVYFCKRATKPFVLDGNINKEFWNDAPFTDNFIDIEGETKEIPRFQTRAKMLWDDDNIYFAAELMGDEIWANVTKRDAVIFEDNDFEIFIDPDSDTHQYYEFEMNARNTVWDLLLTKPYRDGGSAINAWDIKGLQTAVHIDGELNNPYAKNNKWSVEIVMPFDVLKEAANNAKPPSVGDFWRVNFSRVQWKTDIIDDKYQKRKDKHTGKILPEDNWVWSPTGVVNMHYPELWGFVFFTLDGEKYEIPQDEKTKWELRKLYYNQHVYRDKYKVFCNDISILKNNEEYSINPIVEITKNNFEIYCKSNDGKHILSIFADGKVLIQKIK